MSDLEIYFARYGLENHGIDVLETLRAHISPNERLNLLVSEDKFGDPYPGKPKCLHVIYAFNGTFHNDVIREDESLIIPKPLKMKCKRIIDLNLVLGIIIGYVISRMAK